MAKRPRVRKLESTARRDPDALAERVEVVVKVRKADYVPEGVKVRAQISPELFTSVVSSETLQNLEDDPQVQSVAVSQPLRTIDTLKVD